MPRSLKKTFIQMRTILRELMRETSRREWSFEEVCSSYDDYHREPKVTEGTQSRADMVAGWIVPNSSVLDVGCGEGVMLEFLAKHKHCVVKGIDISQIALQKARGRGLAIDLTDADQGLGLRDGENYDYILFLEVLEHLRFPQKALREACSHARQGVVATMPNSGYIRWRIHALKGHSPRQSFSHLHFWSIADFRLFLSQLGLKPLALLTDLTDTHLTPFMNLLAYQQCWLIAPERP